MDELKIQENLIFDKSSGKLIGFIDLGDPLPTFANVAEDSDPIAFFPCLFGKRIGYPSQARCCLLLYWKCNIIPETSSNLYAHREFQMSSIYERVLCT